MLYHFFLLIAVASRNIQQGLGRVMKTSRMGRARHWGAIAGLIGCITLAACGGGGSSDPAPTPVVPTPEVPVTPVTPEPPVTPTPGVATVAISHDGQGSTPPTRVTATFTAKITSILSGLVTIGGSCTTPPVPVIAQNADGLSLTVTMGNGFQCDSGQTLTVSVDPSKLQFDGATLADTSVWTRSWTMAMLPQQIGGNISGLAGRITLLNNGGDALSSLGDGTFLFSTPVAYGAPYAVTIGTQPQGQTCSVNNGIGAVGTVAIRNVGIVCATNTYAVGGNVSGLVGSVTLRLNGASPRTITTNGAFSFTPALAQGSPYAVTVATQPAGQTCTVSNGTGTVNGPVSNVQVACSANAYTVGGTISGLTGSVVLQNNGGDSLTSNSNGTFTFPTPVATGGTYNVTVQTQPAGQTCTVTNGSGTIGGSNVTNVGVTCAANATTISITGSPMIVPVGTGAYSNQLTLTNTGSVPVAGFPTVNHSLGGMTTHFTGCVGLAPGASCTVATSSTSPFVASDAVQISFNNTNTVNVTVGFSLSGQLVYGIKSPGVAMVASAEDPTPYRWAEFPYDTVTGATSISDGRSNTAAIIGSSGSYPAAQSCTNLNTAGLQWYLPAVCELGASGLGCSQQPTIYGNLIAKGLRSSTFLWSSTEDNANNAYETVNNVSFSIVKAAPVSRVCVAEHSY